MKTLTFLLCLFFALEAVIGKPAKENYISRLGKPGEECMCLESKRVSYTMGQVCGQKKFGYMNLIETYLRTQCDLVDPTTCSKDTKINEVDFIVVGAGAAGSVVASRLSENPNDTVVLFEAGGPAPIGTYIPSMYFSYLGDPQVDWLYKIQKQDNACRGSPGGICDWPRGKGMGGTNILHGMMYMRGYPQDYDSLEEKGLTGWSWNDVMPYFLKSEDNQDIGTYADEGYHQKGGLLTVQRFPDYPKFAEYFLEGAKELGYESGIDLNGKHRVGYTLSQATVRDGVRLSTAKAFLYDIPERKNLIIKTNSQVIRVLINEQNEAYGVEYDHNGKIMKMIARKEVILSAGTIGSAQILLLSGIGPREQLKPLGIKVRKHLPGVGRNVRNHASYSIPFNVKVKTEQRTNDMSFEEFMKNRTGPFTSTGLSQLTGFLYTKYANQTTDAPDLQIFFGGFLAGCVKSSSEEQVYENITITPTLLRPTSHGYIKLKSRSHKEQPIIYAGLLNSEHDVDIILEGIRMAIELANTSALEDKIELDKTPIKACEKYGFNTDEYWKCAIRWDTNGENHQVGSCSMGTDDNLMAVTDNQLRVRGINYLRVIDASVFPQVPSGNLNAPVIMVAEKGAQMIQNSWRFEYEELIISFS